MYMEKIGNIVTTSKKNDFGELFNVVKSTDECIEGIPTLVIGWKLVKSIYPDADILDKETHGVIWTFSKTERRCDYEVDIVSFYKAAIMKIMDGVKYVYVDIINYPLYKIKKVVNFFRNEQKKTVFLTKEARFMFVYSKDYNTVFGVSLSLCEYFGIPKKKVIGIVNGADFIRDTSFIDADIRRIIGTNTHYILPLHDYFN